MAPVTHAGTLQQSEGFTIHFLLEKPQNKTKVEFEASPV